MHGGQGKPPQGGHHEYEHWRSRGDREGIIKKYISLFLVFLAHITLTKRNLKIEPFVMFQKTILKSHLFGK